MCSEGKPTDTSAPMSRRALIQGAGAVGGLAAASTLFTRTSAAAQAPAPRGIGERGRRTLIRGGAVLSMDAAVGDFTRGDVLIEGKTIRQVAPRIEAGDAAVIDATSMIVMPGFIDTHHHQFETALRGLLADATLTPEGAPAGAADYIGTVMGKFVPVYRPRDVYISELFGGLSQLDAGVTTVLDISQIHNSPGHTDAVVQGLADAGRRAVMTHTGGPKGSVGDVRRVHARHFASTDQLVTMAMGSEIGFPGWESTWDIGRELKVPIASHVVSTLGARDAFDRIARSGKFGPDNIFIHMTGMSDLGWQAVKDAGSSVSLAVPIEMTMRHGMPPLLKALATGIQPSLSTDVECTMTADFFTQMRSTLTLQRALVNQMSIEKSANLPALLTSRDVLRFATIVGAKALGLDRKVGSLTPGKEADIILLNADAINVAPLNNVPGAVVTLMERSNVDSVFVAGKLRKWRGQLVDVDLSKLRTDLKTSRDYLFRAAKVDRDLFPR